MPVYNRTESTKNTETSYYNFPSYTGNKGKDKTAIPTKIIYDTGQNF